jgi:hypothetical protein
VNIGCIFATGVATPEHIAHADKLSFQYAFVYQPAGDIPRRQESFARVAIG